jgi:hypothetical protein
MPFPVKDNVAAGVPYLHEASPFQRTDELLGT